MLKHTVFKTINFYYRYITWLRDFCIIGFMISSSVPTNMRISVFSVYVSLKKST